jgi:hypothetical protein
MFTINLGLAQEYTETIQHLYKYFCILILFHILVHFSRTGKSFNFGFSGELFNKNFINTLCLILVSYLAYSLIFKDLITFQ